jgi:uncharacterized phage protein (TIGR02218 family)
MSYNTQEESTQGSQPIELYSFTQAFGSAEFNYTSSTNTVEYSGKTFFPESIHRSSPRISGKSSSGKITLKVPQNNPFASRYLSDQPPLPDSLIIYRFHETDVEGAEPEVQVFFAGEVNSVSFTDYVAKISLSTLAERLERSVPKRTFAWSCGHVLFDAGCQVSKEAFRSDVLVTSVSIDGRVLGVSSDPAWTGDSFATRLAGDPDFFNGGLASLSTPSGSHHRTIQGYAENTSTITLSVPVEQVSVGNTLKLYVGCNHAVQTCQSKFDNVRNYGGFPFVPTTNPFSEGIITAG